MIDVLKRALEAAESLPEADQEKIGRELLAHIARVNTLRADLERGVRSLNAGLGRPLDIEDTIRRARAAHGKA